MKTNTLKQTKSFLLLVVFIIVNFNVLNAKTPNTKTYNTKSLSFTLESVQQSCKKDAAIVVRISNGTPPFKAIVRIHSSDLGGKIDFEESEYVMNLSDAGNYDVTITDKDGLTNTQNITIPPYIQASLSSGMPSGFELGNSCPSDKERRIYIRISTHFNNYIKITDVLDDKTVASQNNSGPLIYPPLVPTEKLLQIKYEDAKGCKSSEYVIFPACDATDVTTTLESPESTDKETVMYPNPNNGVLFFDKAIVGEKSISIYNSLGEMVMKTLTTTDQVNINDLNNGIYLINVIAEGKKYTQKIIKK